MGADDELVSMLRKAARTAICTTVAVSVLICGSPLPARAMWSTAGTWAPTREDHERIAVAMASGLQNVGIVYLAKDGPSLDAILAKVSALGGRAVKVDRRVDYVRAIVPTALALQALRVGTGDVAAIDLDLSYYSSYAWALPGNWQSPPKNGRRTQAEIHASRGILSAPSPILHDLSAASWRREHPTYDGRGVNIAIIDALLDPQVPELSGALSLSGRPIRKVSGMHVSIDPGEHSAPGSDLAGCQWVDMKAVVRGSTMVAYDGRMYRLPHAGTFHIGVFNLFDAAKNTYWLNPAIFGSRLGNGAFAVLWDISTGQVWVDTTQSRNFLRDRAMRDYNASGDWNIFGFRHSVRYPLLHPSVSFVVLPNVRHQMVLIGLGIGTHGVGVATSAAGSPVGRDDPVHGVAPAAQVDSFEYGDGSSVHSQAEALIAAFEDPTVDIIVYEWSTYDETSSENGKFISALCNRLVDRFDKAIVVPAGNEADLGEIEDPGTGNDVLAVGASQSAASYQLYEGFRPSANENKHHGGLTDGPGQDGALKPDVLAPSGWIAAVQSYMRAPFAQRVPGLYTLPTGIWDFGGTSQATPTAGGAAALLLSAARQRGFHVDGVELMNALRLGARRAPNLTAIDQGNGLIDVAASWKILVAESEHRGSYVRSLAPVCRGSVRTGQWPNGAPDGGRGIFETIGWHPGSAGTRSMRFCFAHAAPQALHASLLLNDGTYRLAALHVAGTFATVSVAIHPRSAGFHSALLQLTDANGRVMARGMVGIAASAPLDAADGYTMTQRVMVPRPGWTTTWVDVPPNTDALTVDVERDEPVGVLVQDPSGAIRAGLTAFGEEATHEALTIPSPIAGPCEILLLDRHDVLDHTRSLLPVEPAVATVRVQAVRVGGGGEPRDMYAKVPVEAMGSTSQLVSQSATFKSQQPQLVPIDVPDHTDALFLDLRGSDPRVDAYLFNCTRPRNCWLVDQLWGGESDKRLTLGALPAGHYVLALDDYGVGSDRSGLPEYRLTVDAYNVMATSSAASAEAQAYAVQCESSPYEILAAPKCGVFITDGHYVRRR